MIMIRQRTMCFVIVIASAASAADPLIVITEGRTAQQVSSGAYLHMVDPETGAATNGMLISESQWNRDWILTLDPTTYIGTGTGQQVGLRQTTSAERYPIRVDLDPPRVHHLPAALEHELVAAIPAVLGDTGDTIVGLVYKNGNRGTLAYTASNRDISLPLSNIPAAAAQGYNSESIIVIARNQETGDFGLQWCDTTGTRSIHRTKPTVSTGNHFEVTLDHHVVTRDGTRLILGFSGYELGGADGDRHAWIEMWDLKTREFLAQSESLEGTWPINTRPIVTGGQDVLWTLTHTPGRGFVYAAQLELDQQSASTVSLISISGVHETPHMVLSDHPATINHLAIAVDEAILIHDEKQERYARIETPSNVAALSWIGDALYAGVGNNVLQFRPDGSILHQLPLATGIVRSIQRPPFSIGTLPTISPTPQRIPRILEFQEERIGVESYALPNYSRSQVIEIPPWITIGESGDGFLSLSVDPTYSAANTPSVAQLALRDETGGTASETRITVRVRSSDRAEPSLLWIRNPDAIPRSVFDQSSRFSMLINHLSRYPNMFRHDELASSRMIDLSQFTGLVFTSALASHGILTRQEILDYLTHGGTIYYLATAHDREGDIGQPRWLEAVGLRADASTPISGTFNSPASIGMLRHADEIEFKRGTRLAAVDPRVRLIPLAQDDSGAVIATGTYGLGRVIALASSTPLENQALREPRGQRFVEELFASMRDFHATRDDADNDGIPDDIEDRNGNGIQDPGETNHLNPDSDGDGIIDGLEDFNRNGFVDELETQTLLADTDSDGIPDPADPQPIPPTGTPYIASIEPDTMPAEASRSVLITGRNFAPDSEVWFGPVQAPGFRVLSPAQLEAVVPPQLNETPDMVTVRIVNSGTENAAEIGNAFTYAKPTPAKITLRSLNTIRKVYGVYDIVAQAAIDPVDVRLNIIKLVLETDPPTVANNIKITRAPDPEAPILVRELEPGKVLVIVTGLQNPDQPHPLFNLQFEANMIAAQSSRLNLRLVDKVARTEYGGILDTSSQTELVYNFATTIHPLFK